MDLYFIQSFHSIIIVGTKIVLAIFIICILLELPEREMGLKAMKSLTG